MYNPSISPAGLHPGGVAQTPTISPDAHRSAAPRCAVQNSLALAPRLQNPWLAVLPRSSHLVAVQDSATFLPLLQTFLSS